MLLSAFLSYTLASTSTFNRMMKTSMAVTSFSALLMLSGCLGYLKIDPMVQDVLIGVSVLSLLVVGTMINTHGFLLLILTKGFCFTLSALYIFNMLLVHGYIVLA